MKLTSRLRIPALIVTGIVVLTACTTGQDAVVTVTSTQPPPAATIPAVTAPPISEAAGPPTGSSTDNTVAVQTTADPVTTTTSPPPAPAGPKITTLPATKATEVSPISPVTVSVKTGALEVVTLTNPEGRQVSGKFSKSEMTWTSTEPLGYNRTYTIEAFASGQDGTSSQSIGTFTTLKPRGTIFPSFFPNPKMKTVGIGQPMVVIFDKPPTDRVAAERTLTVKTVPAVEGSWYWWDERTLHYRPETYWKPGTKITVTAKVYGVNLGSNMYGETDRTLNVKIGPSKIAKIDDATKQMEVFIDGEMVRTIPVSMGQSKELTVKGKKISLVTPSGIYVAQEKYKVKRMSSATYGLPTDYDLGYDKDIPLAVRISGGGVFVHSAPWSVADQGIRNVSHGCININPEAAKWFYKTFSFGDIVTVTGTSTNLKPTDGFGDWNIPWGQWKQGSALN